MAYAYSYQPFQYICVYLNNGAIIGEIPLTQVSFGKTLNGIGQFTGTIDLNDPNTQIVDPIDLTTPGRTGIMVSYNGSIVAGYAAFASRTYDYEPQKRTLTLNYADLISYFAARTQATDYSSPPYSGVTGPSTPMAIWNAAYVETGGVYVAWDPVLMSWQIISDALTIEAPYSNLLGGLSIAANGYTTTGGYTSSGTGTPSGNYVAQSFPFSSLQTVQTMVNQLSQLGYTVGFDWGFDVAFSNGPMSIPVGTVNFSYPRRGRTVALNNLVLDLRSAYQYNFPEDPSREANTIYETGTAGCIVALQNIFPLEQGIPLLEKVISRSQIQSTNIQTLLFGIGLSDLFLYSYPVVVPQVTVDLYNSTLPFGEFLEGDDVLLTLPATDPVTGDVWDPRFPAGINQEWRIQQWQATVSDDGTSTLQLTFNQPPALVATGPAI